MQAPVGRGWQCKNDKWDQDAFHMSEEYRQDALGDRQGNLGQGAMQSKPCLI